MTKNASQNVHLMAAVFADRERGKVVLSTLEDMHRFDTIDLIDAALVTKDAEGKLHVEETAELTTRKGARRGALVTGVFGLIFPPSLIASVIVGGGIGALAGKLRDTGIKKDEMLEIATRLDTGKTAVIAMAGAESVAAIENALQGYEGEIITQELGEELSADVASIAADESENA